MKHRVSDPLRGETDEGQHGERDLETLTAQFARW